MCGGDDVSMNNENKKLVRNSCKVNIVMDEKCVLFESAKIKMSYYLHFNRS